MRPTRRSAPHERTKRTNAAAGARGHPVSAPFYFDGWAQKGPREAGPLENIANSVALPGKRADGEAVYRVARWQARGYLWKSSTLKRCRSCGRVSTHRRGWVEVQANGSSVGYKGLSTCGSVWACPVCNAKIQAVRRLEVGVALAWILAPGHGGAAFGAYTLRHHQGMKLRPLWEAMSGCWRAVGADKSVRLMRSELGHLGFIRAAETTHGDNGWHPHLHPIHMFGSAVTADDVAALHRVQFRAWAAAAGRLGLEAPREAAQDLHVIAGLGAHRQVGDYFAKATYEPTAQAVGWEMTSTQTKSRSRAKDSRTPWDILRDVQATGDEGDARLWREWEQSSKGRRAITWSRGLRGMIGLDAEATDEEIAETDLGPDASRGFIITDWSPVAARPILGAQLLNIITPRGHFDAGRAFCAQHGITIREIEL